MIHQRQIKIAYTTVSFLFTSAAGYTNIEQNPCFEMYCYRNPTNIERFVNNTNRIKNTWKKGTWIDWAPLRSNPVRK